MMIVLITLAVVLLFAFIGYFRGLLKILLAFLAFFAAAVAGRPLSPLARPVVDQLHFIPRTLKPLSAFILMALAVFIAIMIAGEIIFMMRKRMRKQAQLPPMASWERIGGVVVGGLWGFFLVMVCLIGVSLIGQISQIITYPERAASVQSQINGEEESADAEREAYEKTAEDASSSLSNVFIDWKKNIEHSMLGPLVRVANPLDDKVRQVMENLIYILNDPELFERFRSHPDIIRFTSHPKLMALAEDSEIQMHIQNMELFNLLDNERIAALLEDKELMAELKTLDFIRVLEEVRTGRFRFNE